MIGPMKFLRKFFRRREPATPRPSVRIFVEDGRMGLFRDVELQLTPDGDGWFELIYPLEWRKFTNGAYRFSGSVPKSKIEDHARASTPGPVKIFYLDYHCPTP